MTQPPVPSQHLPFDVRAALVRASQIQDPMQRRKTIEDIEQRARSQYPKYFKAAQ